MNRPFVIVTTRLPPAVCGIGTYSAILRTHWPNERTSVHFLVVAEGATARAVSPHDTVVEFGGNSRRLLEALRKIGTADLLLHYAGRAYDRFGCPRWLPRVLATWKREFPESRVMIFVHEMPARMPITSRHFWFGVINNRIIRRLAAIADVLATNTDHHAARLRQLAKRDDILVVPIGTNIEAPPGLRSGDAGSRATGEFVVFGLPFGRLQTLQAFAQHIPIWIADGQLTKLHLIGPTGDEFSQQADELIAAWPNASAAVRHGALPPSEVSSILACAQYALTNINPETWSKSSAFIACAAHGCTVVRTGLRTEVGPLSHTLTAEEVGRLAPDELEQRTTALARWYEEHAAWPVIAKKLGASFDDRGQRP